MSNLKKAVQEYLDRKYRICHPDGDFDSGGRWYPSEDEECQCCRNIRQPSRSHPLSLNRHCRTIIHVANLHSASDKELRKLV